LKTIIKYLVNFLLANYRIAIVMSSSSYLNSTGLAN